MIGILKKVKLNNQIMQESGLKEYIPGKSINEVMREYGLLPEQIIKLGSNENILGPSKKVRESILGSLNNNLNLGFYPDALAESLVEKIKKQFPEIGNASIVAGNGMDHILECLGRLFLKPEDQSLIHTPTFDYYEIITHWAKAKPIFVKAKLEDNFKVNIDEFLSKISDKTKLIFLCNPNNPTGNVFEWEEIKLILLKADSFGGKVFLDEAYSEFAQKSYIKEVQNFPNLIVGKTFSKVYGLASLRIGWAVLPQQFLKDYQKVQTPFNINSLSLIAAKTALEDQEYIRETIKWNLEGKEFLREQLKNLGFTVFESSANFIAFLTKNKLSASEFCQKLLTKGFILRNVSLFRNAPEGLIRLTIGTKEQNQKFIEYIKELNLN